MANYQKIAEDYPAVPIYLRARIWGRRAETLIYRPNNSTRAFATDGLGFRHSAFEGDAYQVGRSVGTDKFSLVLGSSHIFGFGLPGNEHTIPSRFAEKLGHPVLNMSLPEANSGDFLTFIKYYLEGKKPQHVIMFPGGSFTRFCYTGLCSPMDGPPPVHGTSPMQSLNSLTDTPEMFEHLLRYQKRCALKLAELYGQLGSSFYVVNEGTFFEKAKPSEIEVKNGLGTAAQEQGNRRFERHREHIGPYRERLFPELRNAGIKVLDFGSVDDINFIDEFHYDSPSIQMIVDRLVPQLDARN